MAIRKERGMSIDNLTLSRVHKPMHTKWTFVAFRER